MVYILQKSRMAFIRGEETYKYTKHTEKRPSAKRNGDQVPEAQVVLEPWGILKSLKGLPSLAELICVKKEKMADGPTVVR